MQDPRYPVVLSIAGSDSSGGAGIQGDIKTISALGCYAATAITAITVQDTLGVYDIHPVPALFVSGQIRAVLTDLKPAAIKIGMVYSAELAVAIAGVLRDFPGIPVILDPVVAASSGDALSSADLIKVMKSELFSLATLVTPNLQEAAIFNGQKITTPAEMKLAARQLLRFGSAAVLVKGGHLSGPELVDIYAHRNGDEQEFRSAAIATINTHGTGCCLSAAIASYLALGHELEAAIRLSAEFIHQAILQSATVKTGQGHGPLNHFFDPRKMVIRQTE